MRDGTSAGLGLDGTHSNQFRALMAASAKCKAFEMSAMSSFRAYPCTAADKAEVLSQKNETSRPRKWDSPNVNTAQRIVIISS